LDVAFLVDVQVVHLRYYEPAESKLEHITVSVSCAFKRRWRPIGSVEFNRHIFYLSYTRPFFDTGRWDRTNTYTGYVLTALIIRS
jgi:hypothetical protein